MSESEILRTVKEITGEILGLECSEFNDNDAFHELDADSVDLVEIVCAVEQEFGINIPESVAGDLDTPGKIATFIWENSEA